MKTLWKAISSTTLDAVTEIYRTCDRIEIAKGKINGKPVELDAYEAILARVKINADLISGRFVPGAKSQVLLKFSGVSRNFDVKVTRDGGIVLVLRK